MLENLKNEKKFTGSLPTILIGLIVISFMFTGYNSLQSTPDTVAKVGDLEIKYNEFETEMNRQKEFFKQFYGGDLTQKQMEEMKLKESALRNIVQRKLMSILGTEMQLSPSEEAIKAEIKNLPYFKTNEQFDVTKYKALLEANRLSPQDFEKDVSNSMRLQMVQNLFKTIPISEGYFKDLEKFRKMQYDAHTIQFSKAALMKSLPVSAAEIEKYLADATSKARVESLFNDKKSSFDKPEQVKARHILLMTEGKNEVEVKQKIEELAKTVTPANFIAMANKNTEDPSGKNKGGDLNWFSRGMMVPEFDQVAFSQKPGTISAPVKTQFGYHLIFVEDKKAPVVAKFEDFKNQLTTELIQKEKTEELKNLTVTLSNEIRKALESNNASALKTLVEKYKLKEDKSPINRLDGATGSISLSSDNMKILFAGPVEAAKVELFDDGGQITMVRIAPQANNNVAAEGDKAKGDKDGLKMALSQKLREAYLKKLEETTKVKLYDLYERI